MKRSRRVELHIFSPFHFFDSHADEYNVEFFEHFFIDYLRASEDRSCFRLLDIGGGNGNFSKELLEVFPNALPVVIDPSIEMLNLVRDDRIKIVVGYLPDRLNYSEKADYAHVCNVFHHIVSGSPESSCRLVEGSLEAIYAQLEEGGSLLLTEVYFESYIEEKLSKYALFLLLKILITLGLTLPFKVFKKDLLVCFYTRKELEKMIQKAGFRIIMIQTEEHKISWYNRLFLLKRDGYIFYVCRKET